MNKQVNKKILIFNLLFYLFELTFVLIFHLGMVFIFDNAINTAFKIYRHYHIFALSSGINIYKNIAFSFINVLSGNLLGLSIISVLPLFKITS